MTKEFIYNFIKQHKYGVLATVSKEGVPESAVVGIAITPDLKIIFDTVSDSRKYKNLLLNPNISFVIGWDDAQTVQYEGKAKIPDENELDKFLKTYFEVFPDGIERRENWKNLAYFCVEPTWIRYSDFREPESKIEEIKL